MKNKIFIAAFIVFLMFSVSSYAQYNPFSEDAKLVTVGVGASGWGIPIFLRYEQAVADNITVGGDLSYQSKSYTYWTYTYYGISARGSYHLNEIFDAPDEWDFYAGVSAGFYFFKGSSKSGYTYPYSGSGRPNISGHAGARYFINDNLAINAELGGGSAFSGATVGVTFVF